MESPAYVIVSSTVETEAQALKLATLITSARLAACVQFWPIRSLYWWQGKIESGNEHLLQCKTQAHLAAPLMDFIRSHHSYEIPEIIISPLLAGHPPYLNWIQQETSGHH